MHLFNHKGLILNIGFQLIFLEYYINSNDDEGESVNYGTARGQSVALLRILTQHFPLLAISLVFERFKNCNSSLVGTLASN